MKRLFFVIVLFLSALTAFGQDGGQEASVNDRFFEAKIREFVYRLELTDQQKAQFIPIYQRYNDEMRATIGKPERHAAPPATAEEAAAQEKARIERQQAAQAIRLKYVDEFSTVLEPYQLSQLYQVEKQIQQKLRNRRNAHGRGQGQGRGFDRGQDRGSDRDHDRAYDRGNNPGHGQGRGQDRDQGQDRSTGRNGQRNR